MALHERHPWYADWIGGSLTFAEACRATAQRLPGSDLAEIRQTALAGLPETLPGREAWAAGPGGIGTTKAWSAAAGRESPDDQDQDGDQGRRRERGRRRRGQPIQSGLGPRRRESPENRPPAKKC